MKRIVLGLLAAALFAAPAQAEHLQPRNECLSQPAAHKFQMALTTAIANRDEALLKPLVIPNIHLDFGGGNGWPLLVERLRSDEYRLWDELDAATRLGCAAEDRDTMSMPYYFSQPMPEGYDAYGTYIVLGDSVPLFDSAKGDRIVRRLKWEAVENVAFFEVVEDLENAERWEVRLSDGTRGFVAREKLRALVDYRLIARRINGQWLITNFIAGD